MTVLILFSLIEENLIKPRLYDGSVNGLGRYAFTFGGLNMDFITSDYYFWFLKHLYGLLFLYQEMKREYSFSPAEQS